MKKLCLALLLSVTMLPAVKAGSGFYFYASSTVIEGQITGDGSGLTGIPTTAELQDVKNSTGALALDDTAIKTSTGAIQTSLNNVIASTGALALDDKAIKTSTGVLASVDDAIKVSTGSLAQTDNAIIASTGGIQTSLNNVIASTGALALVDTAIKTSTGAIQTSLNNVIASTGALALVDTAIKTSTGAETASRISGDSVLQSQISGIYLSTMSVFFYISTTVYNASATYFTTTLTTATCITNSTITWAVGSADEIYVAGFSGTVTKATASAVYISLFLDGTWMTPFNYSRWPVTNNVAGTIPMTFYQPFSTSPGTHSICFPMWIVSGTGSIAQNQVVTFSLQRVK